MPPRSKSWSWALIRLCPLCPRPRAAGRGHTGKVPGLHCTHPTQRPLQDIPRPKRLSLWKGGEIRMRIWSLLWDFQISPWPLPTRLSSKIREFCPLSPAPRCPAWFPELPGAPTARVEAQTDRRFQLDLYPPGGPGQFAINHRRCCEKWSRSCCEVVPVPFPRLWQAIAGTESSN